MPKKEIKKVGRWNSLWKQPLYSKKEVIIADLNSVMNGHDFRTHKNLFRTKKGREPESIIELYTALIKEHGKEEITPESIIAGLVGEFSLFKQERVYLSKRGKSREYKGVKLMKLDHRQSRTKPDPISWVGTLGTSNKKVADRVMKTLWHCGFDPREYKIPLENFLKKNGFA